jgi:radical SAM superfamily enzyme YgiQ (UPF0313 family)
VNFDRPDILRPPSEARCYFLPLTSGCSNNSCTYCSFYGCKLQIREMTDIKREIDILDSFLKLGSRIPQLPDIAYVIADEWDCKRIFLQDGDALVYPFDKLIEILGYLNSKFRGLERISSYATPQDISRLTLEQLRILKKNKLGIIYMGVETGDDETLRSIGKGVDSDQIIASGRKIKEAGILLSVTVILGLGGIENSQRHALRTAAILSKLDPDYAGALTLTLIPGTPLFEKHQRGQFTLITPMQSLEELRTLVAEIRVTHCFFSSMHASNYLSVRGTLPEDRAKILNQIEYVLSCQDSKLLKTEYLRGL